MFSVTSHEPTDTPQTHPYSLVDPHTLGRLRVLRIGDIELELDGHQLLVRGTPVHLPHKEFVILRHLMDNAGRVVTRRELLDHAWGPDQANARKNYLEVHIRRLRLKIESDPNRPNYIRTVRKVGYIFDLPHTTSPIHPPWSPPNRPNPLKHTHSDSPRPGGPAPRLPPHQSLPSPRSRQSAPPSCRGRGPRPATKFLRRHR